MVDESKFESWAILELLGHRKLAGKVHEVSIAGSGFLRIDIPGAEGNQATQFYPPSSVYCLTPTTEQLARDFAAGLNVEPVTRWELPERIAIPPPDVRVDFALPQQHDDSDPIPF